MSGRILAFVEAMQPIYGPFSSLRTDQAQQWTPLSEGHKGHYIYTDTFVVIDFLTLYKETSDGKFTILGKKLVQAVHNILGRTRKTVKSSTGHRRMASQEWPSHRQ